MSLPRRFKYHALDVDAGTLLDTFETQAEATSAIIRVGERVALAPGECRTYAVRIESLVSGDTYDIPLEVRNDAMAPPR